MEPKRFSTPEEVTASFAAAIAALQKKTSTPSPRRFSSPEELEAASATEEARAAASASSPKKTPKPPSKRFFSFAEELKAARVAEEARASASARSSKKTPQPPSKRFFSSAEELRAARAAEEARASAPASSSQKTSKSSSKRFFFSAEEFEAARAAEEVCASASATSPKKTLQPPSKRFFSSSEELEAACSAEEAPAAASAGSPKKTPKPSPKRFFFSAEESHAATLASSPKKTPKLSPPSTALASSLPPEHQHHSPQPVHRPFPSTITNSAPAAVLHPKPDDSAAGSRRSTPLQQWPQPFPQSQELPYSASRSASQPRLPIPPIPTFGFHIPPRSSPQIPLFSCFSWPPPPASQAPPPPAILRKKDGSPADYGTKFLDLCDESRAFLLQIEMRIQEFREESKQLDQCSRLHNVPTNFFELQSKSIFQEAGKILFSVEKQKVPIQQMLASVRTMMWHGETAVQSCKQLFLERNIAATYGVLRFYRGISRKPSPYMQQTATRFGSELTELLRWIEEVQENLQVPSSRGWSLESIPNTMSNLHQTFLHIAAKVEDIHQSLEILKKAYLADQHHKGNTANPFLEADRREAAQQCAAARRVHPTLQVAVQPQPTVTYATSLASL